MVNETFSFAFNEIPSLRKEDAAKGRASSTSSKYLD